MQWLDKADPAEPEAERALLGGLLLDSTMVLDVFDRVSPDEFHDRRHAALYRLMLSMAGAGQPIDLVTIGAAVASSEDPAVYGGAAYVAQLPEECPASVNVVHYADLVRTAAYRRGLIRVGVDMANDAFDRHASPEKVASQVQRRLAELGGGSERFRSVSFAEACREAEEYRLGVALGHHTGGHPTGFRSLDTDLGGGFEDGSLVVIAGATSMGKTGLAVALSCQLALAGRHVLFVSCEMPRRQVVNRMRSYLTQIPYRAFKRQLTGIEQALLDKVDPSRLALTVHYRPGISIHEVGLEARRVNARNPIDAIVIDYLQIMEHESRKGDTGAAAVGRTSKLAKQLAGTLDVPVMLLSQLNRGFDRRQGTRAPVPPTGEGGHWWEGLALPELSDLAESGQIEHNADVVLFPVNAPRYGLGPANAGGGIVVGKQRNGPRSIVPCKWDAPCATYRAWGSP